MDRSTDEGLGGSPTGQGGGAIDRPSPSTSRPLNTSTHTHTKQLFPTFSLATIRGAGHWVHAEKPEETLQMVQRYLDEEMDI